MGFFTDPSPESARKNNRFHRTFSSFLQMSGTCPTLPTAFGICTVALSDRSVRAPPLPGDYCRLRPKAASTLSFISLRLSRLSGPTRSPGLTSKRIATPATEKETGLTKTRN
jgi:hypothetical protein